MEDGGPLVCLASRDICSFDNERGKPTKRREKYVYLILSRMDLRRKKSHVAKLPLSPFASFLTVRFLRERFLSLSRECLEKMPRGKIAASHDGER